MNIFLALQCPFIFKKKHFVGLNSHFLMNSEIYANSLGSDMHPKCSNPLTAILSPTNSLGIGSLS